MASNGETSEDSVAVQNSNFLLNTLDEMEKRVEELRDNAKKMEEERKSLLGSLNTMLQSQALVEVNKGDREELELFIDRLTKRCLTIEITVHIIRSPSQEKSLQTVLKYLHDLIGTIHSNMQQSRQVIERYLNSCITETKGPVDDKFQAALLGCTAEDQKDVRKRLEALWASLERAEKAESSMASAQSTVSSKNTCTSTKANKDVKK
ncbi:BAG family molecular chaperone regulator 2-like [Amphiura filiformis]|uniref:BAG family molecular chaperone regulator 2-like n=1 Tax=Amphiura filiformis TaxID=82378 RepID=UPI003B222E46